MFKRKYWLFLSLLKTQIYSEKRLDNSYKSYYKKQKQANKSKLLYTSSPQMLFFFLEECSINMQYIFQGNSYAEVWFQLICNAYLLKSHFCIRFLL